MPQRDDPHLVAAKQAGEELTATQRSKVRRLSAPKEIDESEQAGELNIVPFLDIITNVMMFVLASLAVTFTVTLAASAPKSGRGRDVPKDILDESLGLTIVVGTDGYWIVTPSRAPSDVRPTALVSSRPRAHGAPRGGGTCREQRRDRH
jgi:hypothetical protein